jgi:hypothetical protein
MRPQTPKKNQGYHDHPIAGHPGSATMYFNLAHDYWWPGMTTNVKEYVKGYNKCQRIKINNGPWKGLLMPIKGPPEPLPFK